MISDVLIQENVSYSAFPLSRTTFDAQIKVLQNPFYEFADSEIIIGENGGFYADGEFYDIDYDTTPLITDKQLKKLYGLLDEIDSTKEGYDEVYSIIYEEVSAYFADAKELNDTVDLIQSRMSIYVSEHS